MIEMEWRRKRGLFFFWNGLFVCLFRTSFVSWNAAHIKDSVVFGTQALAIVHETTYQKRRARKRGQHPEVKQHTYISYTYRSFEERTKQDVFRTI